MVASDVDVLVVVVDGSPVVETGSVDGDDVDAVDSVDVQAPSVSSVTSATPRRNGSRLRPPNPNDEHRGLNWLPHFPIAKSTLRVEVGRWWAESDRVISSKR